MKKVWFTSVILSGAMAAGLYAQQSTTASSANNDHVTVQGCVERAGAQSSTAGTTGTTGSTATTGSETGSTVAGGQFVLTNVSNSNTASTTAGTTGTTGSTAASSSSAMPAASQYRLDDNGQNRLASYVGQKVEVSGTVENGESSATGSTAGTTGSTASGTTGSTASTEQSASSNENGPKLKVDSIRMIASSCQAR